MSARPVDVDPTDVAIAELARRLPGFESSLIPGRDMIGIRGALPISTTVSREAVFYPLLRSDVFVDTKARSLFDAVESDAARAARHERQREALKRELEPIIDRIVESVQGYGIKALGLEEVIEARERRARIDGQRVGHEIGRAAGYRVGRDEGFAAGVLHGIAKAASAVADIDAEGDGND